MAGIEFDTSQVRQLAADLGKASGRVGARSADVVIKTARDIERDAKTLAPVDTGNLRSSISTTVNVTGLAQSSITAEVGPTASYGHFVELGTSRMAPQPYLFPATDRHEPGFNAAMEQLAEELLE